MVGRHRHRVCVCERERERDRKIERGEIEAGERERLSESERKI